MMSPRQLTEVSRQEALQLLGSVPYGRVVFTHHALPAIRAVNHLLAGEQIIIRTNLGSAIASAVDAAGTVVAYEADLIDADLRLGWSVVVVGRASRIISGALAARYRKALIPWTDEGTDEVITITADIVTGFRMIAGPADQLAMSSTEIPTA